MSGLSFLLWTIAAILILGVVIFVAFCIYAYHARERVIKGLGKKQTFMDRLKEVQAEQEALLKQHNKK